MNPSFHLQSGASTPTGARQAQNEDAINPPVTKAARKPARDFRGANGIMKLEYRHLIGRMLRILLRKDIGSGKRSGASKCNLRGRGSAFEPNARPMVDAAVSAHDNLMEAISRLTITSRQTETHTRMETTARSSGKTYSTTITPRRYHTTPLILCYSGS